MIPAEDLNGLVRCAALLLFAGHIVTQTEETGEFT